MTRANRRCWLRNLCGPSPHRPSSRDSTPTNEVVLCEYPRHPQAVVEDERMVTGLVPSAPHLHDAKLALHPELALARESQVEDSIREILLLVPRICRPGRPVRTRIGRQLAQEERGAVEIPQPVDEGEHVSPRLAELREDFQGVERVEDEEPIVEGFADALRVQLEQVHPRLYRRPGELLAQLPQVQDAQVPARIFDAIPDAVG